MRQKWRLLDTGALDAATNMALEKVLLNSCLSGSVSNTLHLLEFHPCALLGYNQSLGDEVDEDFCRENGIEINRRISGGGCIYMDRGTLGWEIIAKKDTPGIPGNLEGMYGKLCGGLISALSSFGIDASYRPLNDVEVGGRKISGAGGTELGDSFIFHGTVLMDFDSDIMTKALRNHAGKRGGNREGTPESKSLEKLESKFESECEGKLENKQSTVQSLRTVCMRELLGAAPPVCIVKSRLMQAFSEILDIGFEPGELSRGEKEALAEELPLFCSNEWIYAADRLRSRRGTKEPRWIVT